MDFKDDLSVKSDDTCSSFDNLTDANEVEEKILLEFNNEDDFFYVKIENNVPPIQQDQDVESIDAYIENPLKDIDKIDLNYVLLTKSNAPLLEQHVFSSDCEDLPCELETSQISLTNFDDKIELDSTDYLIVKDDESLAENFDCMLVEEPLNLHLKSYDNNFINEIVELNNFEEALIKETLDKLNSSFVHLQKSFNPYMDNILRSFFYFDYDKCLTTIKEQETLKMIKNFENLGHVEENEEEELDAMDRHFFSSTMLLILMASCLITFSFLFFEDKSYQHKMNPTFMRASPYSQFKKYSLHSKIYGPNLLPPDFSTRNNILAYSSVTYNYYNGRLRQSSLFLSRNFTIISSNLISPEQFCESNGNRQPFIVDNQNLFLSPTPPASNKTRYLQKICESLKRKSAQRAKVWSEALNLSRGLGRLTSTTVALNRYLSHNLNKDRRRQLYGFPNLSRFVAGLRTLDDSIHLIRKIDTKIAELQPFCRIRKKNNLEYFLHTSAGLLEYLPSSIRVVNRDSKSLEPRLFPIAISLTRLHALTTVSGQTYLNQRNGPIKNTKRSTSNLVENDIFPVKRDPFSKIDHPIYDGNYTRKHRKNWSCCLRYKSLTNRTLPIPIFSITKQHSMASTTTLGLKLSSVNGTFSLPKLTSCFEKILQIPLNNYISFQPKIKSFIPTFSSVLTSIKHGRNINHPYNTANETYKPVTYSKDEIIISPLMRRIDLNTADVSDIFTGNESLEKDTNAALSLRFCKTFNQTLTDYLLYNYEKDDFSLDFTFSDNNHNNLYYMRICQRELLQLRQKFGKNTSSPFAKNKIQLVTMNPVMHQRKPLLTAGAVSAATVGIEKYGYPNIVKQTIFPSQYYSLLQRLPNNRRNHHHLVTTNSQDVLFFSDTLKQAWPRNLDEFVILLGELDAFARTIDAFAKEYSRRLDKRFHYMIDNTVARKPIQETLSPFSLEKRAFVTDWMRDMEGFKGLRRLRKDVNRTLRVLRDEYRAALFEPSLDSVFFLSNQKLIIPKHHPSLDFIKVDLIRTNKVAPSTQIPFENKYFYENNCKIIRENRRKHGKFMDKTKLLPIMNRNSSHLSKSNDNHLPKERMDLKGEFGHEYRAENHVCNKTGCYHVTHEEESIIHPAVFGSDKSIVVATTHSLSSFIHKHDLQSVKISQKTFEKGEKAKTISVDVSTSLSGRESVVLTKTLSFGPIPPPYDVNINNTL